MSLYIILGQLMLVRLTYANADDRVSRIDDRPVHVEQNCRKRMGGFFKARKGHMLGD